MTIPIRNVYYLLCYAWGHLDETDLVDRATLAEMNRVQDMLGKVLAEGTFRLVRRGIDRGYRQVTAEVAGVRGKLEPAAMAKTAVRARSRTICTFEEFSADILHNQILRSTLETLLQSGALSPSVQQDVALAHQKLSGISTVPVRAAHFRRVQLSRNQRMYQLLLSVCLLAHQSLLVDEHSGAARFHDFRRDRKVMWKLFEDFTLEFFRAELEGFRVHGQRQVPWHDVRGTTSADEAYLPKMEADIILESADRRVILDTKFYRTPLSSRWGSTKLRSKNLYQLMTYLENRQASIPDGPKHEGILLYAAVGRPFEVELSIRGFRVHARTVDLSRPWREIHRQMLEVIAPRMPLAEPGAVEVEVRS